MNHTILKSASSVGLAVMFLGGMGVGIYGWQNRRAVRVLMFGSVVTFFCVLTLDEGFRREATLAVGKAIVALVVAIVAAIKLRLSERK